MYTVIYRRRPFFLLGLAALTLGPLVAMAAESAAKADSVEQIVQRLVAMNDWRASELRRYRATRRYVAENKRLGKRAEMTVEEQYSHPGHKELDVLSEVGSNSIRRRVFDKLIAAELDSNLAENRDQSRVSPDNYTFSLLGAEPAEGRECYLLEIIPKQKEKYLMRGRIWVDQEDFAIVRMEGQPAKKPSFWVREASFVRRYAKIGSYWLPVSLESVSKIFIIGASTLSIEYGDYSLNGGDQAQSAGAGAADHHSDYGRVAEAAAR